MAELSGFGGILGSLGVSRTDQFHIGVVAGILGWLASLMRMAIGRKT